MLYSVIGRFVDGATMGFGIIGFQASTELLVKHAYSYSDSSKA